MWLLRFKMRSPRPLARAAYRAKNGAASTNTFDTLSSSISAPWLCSALAMADSSTLCTMRAAFLRLNARILSALATGWPRIWSQTSRAFCGEIRAWRSLATTCMTYALLLLALVALVAFPALVSTLVGRRSARCGARRSRCASGRGCGFAVARVPLERARRRELAELVTHHVLG